MGRGDGVAEGEWTEAVPDPAWNELPPDWVDDDRGIGEEAFERGGRSRGRGRGDRSGGGGSAGDRVPPHDLDAERSVLGGMLLSKDAVADVVESLRGEDFYKPAHETIYETMMSLYAGGEPIDVITLANELGKQGLLANVGGAPYLHTLVQTVPTAANSSYYAKIVHERAVLRRMVGAGTKITQWGFEGEGEVDLLVDRAQEEMYSLTSKRSGDGYRRLADLLPETTQQVEAKGLSGGAAAGINTGFYELDELTGGLQPGQMIVIAARPGLGKSTLGLDIARAATIHQGKTAAIFSLEMGADEITLRLLSAEAQVHLSHLRSGHMTDDDWNRVSMKMAQLEQANLFIDDSPNLTMTEIRAKARRLKQREGLALVIIDYLQLMSSGKKVESRQVEVSEFSRSMKLLAKELQLPVIAMSQLNRGSESRTDKRPQLSDLRESGAIEQDADMVILLHREDTYNKESQRQGEADFLVVKHRNGPTKDITVAFQGHYSKFANLARD